MLTEDETEALLSLLEIRMTERMRIQMAQLAAGFQAELDKRISAALASRTYLPDLTWPVSREARAFMAYSTCSAADFFHPRYVEICASFGAPPILRRKYWEWVFIIHKLTEAGVLREGARGVVFGVGREKLPSMFASMGASIVATDAPPDLQSAAGWSATKQHAGSLDQLYYADMVSRELFDRRVTHRYCDMRAIDPELTDFDFTWSSCCFEHLGSLEAGLQFVIESVEKTLKIGGIACHTTEFNLSSNTETMTEGSTVIYRSRDMIELVERLRDRGHEVEPFVIAPDAHPLDYHVDVPPYNFSPHLKLQLGKYVATSAGIVVRRGR